MSDLKKLKAELLERSDTETQRQFAEMLAKACAQEELNAKGHTCWLIVPTAKEWELMSRFAGSPKCPKCGKGRVILEIFRDPHHNFGDNLWLKCRWGEPSCDFKQYVSNLDDI